MNEAHCHSSLIKKKKKTSLLFFIGQNMSSMSHYSCSKIENSSSGFFFLICVNLKFTDTNEWLSLSRVRGVSAATAHTFFKIRWCILAVTWTLCASSVIKHNQADNGKERERPPQAPLLLTSLAIFSLKLFSGLPLVLDPRLGGDDGGPHLPSSILIYVFNCPNSWTSKIKNGAVWRDYRPAVTHWWKFSSIFDSICSPQHTDGRLTGREGEDRRADAQTVGRLDTSLTVLVTLGRCGAERLEMQPDFTIHILIQNKCIYDGKKNTIRMSIFSHIKQMEYLLQKNPQNYHSTSMRCYVWVVMLLKLGPDSTEEDNSELRVRVLWWPGAASREKGRLGHFPSQFKWLMFAGE